MKITKVSSTWQYKLKRIVKYILVIIVFMIACSFVDALVKHFIDNPWFTFKGDWKFVWGAMIYRLLSTWQYE